MNAQVTIEAIWEDGVWKVHVDRTNNNAGFICSKLGLKAALKGAVDMALENYEFRKYNAEEKLEGPL